MSSLILIGLTFLVVAGPVFFFKHLSRKKFIDKVSKMSFQQRQLEMMKLQTAMSKYKTSHVLHFLLCIPTFGFWIPVWFLVTASNGSQMKAIEGLMSDVSNTEAAS